jgi:hypothetical protein
MEKNKTREDAQVECRQNMLSSNRRYEDRRTEPCEGYTYVSMVGWICRRETCRRSSKNRLPEED